MLALFLVPSLVEAQAVTLAWDPSAGAAGYIVRWGTTQGTYPHAVDTGSNTTVILSGLVPATTYFAVAEAYNAQGVFSSPTPPLQFVVPVPMHAPQLEVARADFSGDGRSDLLWQDTTNGYLAIWALEGHQIKSVRALSHFVPSADWQIVGTGDFNADSKPDIVWQHRTDGWLYLWYMDGVTRIGETFFSVTHVPDTAWKVVAVGDMNGDLKPDLVWQHETDGWLAVWLMDGRTLVSAVELTPNRVADPGWKVVGIGDFDTDGDNDLVWRHRETGHVMAWLMSGRSQVIDRWITPNVISDLDWRIVSVIDANGDMKPDLVWHHATTGLVIIWYMDGLSQTSDRVLSEIVSVNWKIVGAK